MLTLDYSRQEGAADREVMRMSHVVQVGVGSGSELTKQLVRMGIGKISVVDPDIVEFRNVSSQGYSLANAVAATEKVVALVHECKTINPEAQVIPIHADFFALSDREMKELLSDATVLVMTTDYHPAQARGALAGLICDVPTILASIYRRGRAGEIIYFIPGLSRGCYRCITKERYDYVANHRMNGAGNAAGSLPFAAAFVDSIVGHLVIGILHKRQGAYDNPYAQWIGRLDQRNFIQTRMDPDYRLGDEDPFGDVFGHGEKIFNFDTIWQSGAAEVKADCPDCHGKGAVPVGERLAESTEIRQLSCGCLIPISIAEEKCYACGSPAIS